MIVRKTEPLPVECVVRGYLAGSGWKEYQETRQRLRTQAAARSRARVAIAGADLHAGDEERNRPRHQYRLGGMLPDRRRGDRATQARALSLRIYAAGREHAAKRGIIVADTKFEFGLLDDQLLLIDECLTPDSSRFWPADGYVTGKSPPSYDKQFVRDYLETLDWDKTPPAPSLAAGSDRENVREISRGFPASDRRRAGHVARPTRPGSALQRWGEHSVEPER